MHRHRKIAAIGSFCPIGGIDAGRAVKSVNCEATVIGKRREAAGFGRKMRFDPGISDKGVLGLVRFFEPEIAGGDHLDPERGQKLRNLAQFAFVL